MHANIDRTKRLWRAILCASVLLVSARVSGSGAVVDRRITIDLIGGTVLPTASRMRLAEEVRRIWEQYGVHVEGLNGSISEPAALRVELITDGTASDTFREPHAIGTFRRSDDRVLICLPAAVRVAIAGTPIPQSLSWPDIGRDYTLDTVLGRTIAHEIGHYLLGPGHVTAGLMRATFRAPEMVDPRYGLFTLTATDLARLLAVSQPFAPPAGLADQRVAAAP